MIIHKLRTTLLNHNKWEKNEIPTQISNVTIRLINSYRNSKSAVALSLNAIHNWFCNIRNLCRKLELPLSLTHCVLNMVTFKKYHALLNDRLICRCKYFPKTAMDGVVQRPNLISIYFLSLLLQISTNFDNFWQKDGKEAKIMQGALIFHLT